MNSRQILLTVFVIVALAQLYVPAKMILNRENTLKTGKEYRFRTAPIDPADPFRGKYLILSFKENTVDVPKEKNWTRGEIIYVSLKADEKGFAGIKSVSKEKPSGLRDFVKAKVVFVTEDGPNQQLTIDYPFDRYYMEESKAGDAEQTYRHSLQDTTLVTYALVSIKDGDAVLKDVIINGKPIKELVKKK